MNRKLLWMLGLVLIAVSACLGGCGNKSEPAPEASEQAPSHQGESEAVTCVFEGEAGLDFVARFEGEKAWVFLPEGTLQLPMIPAASGAKYSDGQVTLWTKGEEATLTREGQSEVKVRNNRRRAVWEHAKLNGVDFRAVGNEPGWVLELWGDGRVVFVGDYGQSRYEFDRPKPETDQAAKQTTYHCSNRDNKLTVILTGTACWDTMADEGYETTVQLVLNGKNFQGCGRALH